MWVCKAHIPRGPAGIAIFVGQVQTAEQTQRYTAYQKYEVAGAETDSVEMYMWFTQQYAPERYIHQGDFGFCERIAEYSRIWRRPVDRADVLLYGHWPFEQARDEHGMTLVERLRDRMASQTTLSIFRCRHTCEEDFAIRWFQEYGEQLLDHQTTWPYLTLELNCLYVRLAVAQDWWLVCPLEFLCSCRLYAGWASCYFFDAMAEYNCAYFEIDLVLRPERLEEVVELRMQSVVQPPRLEPVGRSLRAGRGLEALVVSDGSADEGRGFAAAYVASVFHMGDRCSVACCMNGAQMAELCGILHAVLSVYAKASELDSVEFHCDNENAVNAVFLGQSPSTRDGSNLWPGILACRFAIDRLVARGVAVQGRWVSRKHTKKADLVCKAELRERRSTGWSSPERWPEPLTDPLQRMFVSMMRQRASGQWGQPLLPPGIQAELGRILV